MAADKLKCIGLIPARYASIRFPGKSLALILGKTLIQRTYENALLCPLLNDVVVATDDLRIFQHVEGFGGKVVMTSPDCTNGTERLEEAYRKHYYGQQIDLIVNIQGDEPCVDPSVVRAIIEILKSDPAAAMSTAVVKIDSIEEASNSSVVKCVIDPCGNAVYFSRSLIPGNKTGKYHPSISYYKHLGIYCYRPEFLLKYATLKATSLQLTEDLEQLKVLEHGYRIKAAIVESCSVGVDIPEDIYKIEKILCKQNTSSSLAESVPHLEKD